MLRHVMIGLAAATLASATLIPDDALARARGGGVGVRGGVNRAHVAHPIAGRNLAYRGGAYRGAAWGAAAVGAAAVGAGYYGNSYYNNNCYRDAYGQLICPNQYQYRY
jgi:hypothetical protein